MAAKSLTKTATFKPDDPQVEAAKPTRPEPTRSLAVGLGYYERILAFFADPANAARFEKWREERKAGIA